LVARSSSIVHGTRPRTFATVVQGVSRTFPAAVWHARLPILVSAVVFLGTFVVVAFFFATTPAAIDIAMPAETREAYLEHDFEAYYSSEPGTTFAARVFTNNAGVAFLAFGEVAVRAALGVVLFFLLPLGKRSLVHVLAVLLPLGELAVRLRLGMMLSLLLPCGEAALVLFLVFALVVRHR
jgi:hypothetical protein